jgi:hypothetical protein
VVSPREKMEAVAARGRRTTRRGGRRTSASHGAAVVASVRSANAKTEWERQHGGDDGVMTAFCRGRGVGIRSHDSKWARRRLRLTGRGARGRLGMALASGPGLSAVERQRGRRGNGCARARPAQGQKREEASGPGKS